MDRMTLWIQSVESMSYIVLFIPDTDSQFAVS